MSDVDRLVKQLSLDEKAMLTAGADMFTTVAVERLGIPSIHLTDGPNGARGTSLPGDGMASSACVPCGSALGATWNVELVQQIGVLLGDESRSKACRVLLAPTVNIHRSPLAGRNFECYSEDPLLSGRLAAAFVRGVQSRGVATTVKHFVGNDAETERQTMDSVIDERSLREIYLVPFELAVREGGALGVMTGYNRLNGGYCSEDRELLGGILRREWGFDGFVVSDWYARGSTLGSALAGLDLEMPGPGRFFGVPLAEAVRTGQLDEGVLDGQVSRLLSVAQRVGALDDAPGAPEESVDLPAHRELARRAAAEATVLLANDGILPLDPANMGSLALVGPNADLLQIHGGGSAMVRPHYWLSLADSVRAAVGDRVDVVYAPGCDIAKTAPALELEFRAEFFGNPDFGGVPVYTDTLTKSRFLYFGRPTRAFPSREFSLRARGQFVPATGGTHEFSLVQAGQARLLIDGAVVLDGVTDPAPRGEEFFGQGSQEIAAMVDLTVGRTHEVVIEYSTRGAEGLHALRIGCRSDSDADLLQQAVSVARAADVAIVVVGTSDEWETEGIDRVDMDLPGAQDELIARVIDANPNAVVVINAGAPVTMRWASRPRAILQGWLGGQEMANALAAVLVGTLEPSGRLPTTLPMRIEDNSSYGSFPGENSTHRYGEGLLVGYRWYERRGIPPRFAFGHGLSYTSFSIGPPRLSSTVFVPGEPLSVVVGVTNTGRRAGAEVVQCYVAPAGARLMRPVKELKAFVKAWVEPGETVDVSLQLGDRAFAYWDPGDEDWWRLHDGAPPESDRHRRVGGWTIDPGSYDLCIGRSSIDIAHIAPVTVVQP